MRLRLGGYLNFYNPDRQSSLWVDLDGPTLLTELLKKQHLPAGDIFLVVVNGCLVDLEKTLVGNEDRVELYPPMGGG